MSYVCGRVGEHVDEFLLLRNHQDPCWLRSPWKKGTFVFGGIQLQRVQNHTILLSQEQFCNDFRPVVIENEKKRAKNDKTFTVPQAMDPTAISTFLIYVCSSVVPMKGGKLCFCSPRSQGWQ